jgi:hypothetical protein
VNVGKSRGGHARGERRRVQLVIGVQRQRDVERTHRGRVGALARQHVEEVRGMTERRIRLDRRAARVHPAERRDQARELRRQADRLARVGLRRIGIRVRIAVRERRGHRAEDVHPVRRRQALQQPQHRFRQRPRRRQRRVQIAQLRAVRQPPVPQQETHFLERRVLCEIVNIVPAIRQHSVVTIQITDGGGGGDDVFETCFCCDWGAHIAPIISVRLLPSEVTNCVFPK